MQSGNPWRRDLNLYCALSQLPSRYPVLASLRGTDRSTLLNSVLDEALRGVVVSLRGPLAEGGAGEQSPLEAGAALLNHSVIECLLN